MSESYWLTCKYYWISGQFILNFMIKSISNRSTFKTWSPKLCKAISVSAYHDDLWSFAQIAISVLDRRKGFTFDRTHSQRTNAYKSAKGFRWTSLTISYTRSTTYKSVKGSWLTSLTISYTRSAVYKSISASWLTSLINFYAFYTCITTYKK
jgi:hypothetical protein